MVGGRAPWRASFRALASMAWTAPLDVLALAIPVATVPLFLYRVFLLSVAGETVQGLSRTRAIAAAALLGVATFLMLIAVSMILFVATAGPPGPTP
jgi:hypothetical protein